MNEEVLKSIQAILDTFGPDEGQHFGEWKESHPNADPEEHLYSDIKRVQQWLDENTKDTQEQKYVSAKGTRCLNPACNSSNLEGQGVEIDAGIASQEVICPECGWSWTDLYQLIGVDQNSIETE